MGALAIDLRDTPASRPAQPRLFVVGDPAIESERPGSLPPLTAAGHAGAAAVAPRTLDDILAEAWGAVVAGRSAVCPMCAGALRPAAGTAGGRCQDCATTLE